MRYSIWCCFPIRTLFQLLPGCSSKNGVLGVVFTLSCLYLRLSAWRIRHQYASVVMHTTSWKLDFPLNVSSLKIEPWITLGSADCEERSFSLCQWRWRGLECTLHQPNAANNKASASALDSPVSLRLICNTIAEVPVMDARRCALSNLIQRLICHTRTYRAMHKTVYKCV